MEGYEIDCIIGMGRQGFIRRARDRVSNMLVAVKDIYFPDEEEGVSNIMREISILKDMSHPNIVRLLDVVPVPNGEKVNLIFEHMDLDLAKFMKAEPLVEQGQVSHQIKIFLRQILSGIAYCHSRDIIHGELTPRNLLIKSGSNELMIADFGAARPLEVPLSSYSYKLVLILFYVAPEILLGSKQYSTAIDVWSVGCIFAEMVIQKPLFEASDVLDLFSKIFSMMGTPTEESWPGLSSFCELPLPYPKHEPKNLAEFVPGLKEAGIDLLTRMLCLNPSRRITAQEALQHEYFNDVEPFP